MLQTALPDIVPVLTPRTLDTLIQSLEEHNREDDRLSRWLCVLQDLKPLVFSLKSLFLPLLQARTRRQFSAAFDTNSRAFEPYRLYLSTKLLPLLVQERDFLDSYRDILDEVTSFVLASAPDKGFHPGRLRSVLDGYFKVFQSLVRGSRREESTPILAEQLPVIEEFIHLSTRFDYGLTATYLVLEGTLPPPAKRVASLMLSASEEALNDFTQYSLVVRECQTGGDWRRARAAFGRSRHRAHDRAFQAETQSIVARRVQPTPKRQVEVSWLRSRPNLSKEFAGKWIVVDQDRLIASDTDYDVARARAVAAGVRCPFIIYISPERDESFMGL